MPEATSVQEQASLAWLSVAKGYACLAAMLPEPCRGYYKARAEMAFDMATLCAQGLWPTQQ